MFALMEQCGYESYDQPIPLEDYNTGRQRSASTKSRTMQNVTGTGIQLSKVKMGMLHRTFRPTVLQMQLEDSSLEAIICKKIFRRSQRNMETAVTEATAKLIYFRNFLLYSTRWLPCLIALHWHMPTPRSRSRGCSCCSTIRSFASAAWTQCVK